MNDAWWVNENDLDPDQKRIISHSIKRDHFITGSPGTGKTNLLVLKAVQMNKTGLVNTRLLMSTRSLKEFVAAGGSRYKFDSKQVMTFDRWMISFLWDDHHIQPANDSDYQVQRQLRVRQCLKVAQNYTGRYDAIFVDEGQDCLKDEVILYKKLGKVCWVAADPKQSIYQAGIGYREWKNIIDPQDQTRLQFHYRNGKAICELADLIQSPSDPNDLLTPYMRYNEKTARSQVDDVPAASLEGQFKNVIDLLRNQLRAYPDELIGVLTPVHEVLTPLMKALRETELSEFCIFQDRSDGEEHFMEFSPGKRIFVSTAHSSKGLEARALHIVGGEKFNKMSLGNNLVYTTVIRAKTSLMVHHTGALPSFFQSALNQTKPLKQVGINDLFGGN